MVTYENTENDENDENDENSIISPRINNGYHLGVES